jgi:hypothetical protein
MIHPHCLWLASRTRIQGVKGIIADYFWIPVTSLVSKSKEAMRAAAIQGLQSYTTGTDSPSSTFVRSRSPVAEFAFLSACHTGGPLCCPETTDAWAVDSDVNNATASLFIFPYLVDTRNERVLHYTTANLKYKVLCLYFFPCSLSVLVCLRGH